MGRSRAHGSALAAPKPGALSAPPSWISTKRGAPQALAGPTSGCARAAEFLARDRKNIAAHRRGRHRAAPQFFERFVIGGHESYCATIILRDKPSRNEQREAMLALEDEIYQYAGDPFGPGRATGQGPRFPRLIHFFPVAINKSHVYDLLGTATNAATLEFAFCRETGRNKPPSGTSQDGHQRQTETTWKRST